MNAVVVTIWAVLISIDISRAIREIESTRDELHRIEYILNRIERNTNETR